MPKKIKIMGVLNVTPDSFYDGSNYNSVDKAIAHGEQLIKAGSDILDVGGVSTRPAIPNYEVHAKVEAVSLGEELQRVMPIIEYFSKEFPHIALSIDSSSPQIIKECLKHNVQYVNCLTEQIEEEIPKLLTGTQAKLIVYHAHGKPQYMQQAPFIQGDIVAHLIHWFKKQLSVCLEHGMNKDQFILDPGIGFGKEKPRQDLEILRGLKRLSVLSLPIMVGLSMKSFMGKILDRSAQELQMPTVIMNTIALMNGAEYLRVHHVEDHVVLRRLIDAYSLESVAEFEKQWDIETRVWGI